jgi:glycosyltransferase involved in cell wall biosynthesis
MDRLRLLIVSYHFPPAAGGGVQRVLAWAKYLPRDGVDVEVLAPDDPGWLQRGGVEAPDGTVVHRSRNRGPTSVLPERELASAGWVRRLAHKASLRARWLLFPDIRVGWSLSAIPAGRRIVRERGIDAVLSTSPPRTTHRIGAALSRDTGVPWVADYRDSWLDLPHLRLDRPAARARHALDVRYANRLMRQASLITTVSEPLAADLRRRHPERTVEVIPNGVDLERLDSLPEAPPLVSGAPREDRFVVSYTGNFFGRQSPQTFLAALEAVLERRPDVADRLVVRFVGEVQAQDHARIEGNEELRHVIERVDFLPWPEALAEQRAADLLLLYVAPGRGSEGVFTGKVFEYVAAARPILALVPHDNVAVQLVRDAGTGIVVDPDDVPAITAALEHEFDEWAAHVRHNPVVPRPVLESISRERQSARLAELLRGLA